MTKPIEPEQTTRMATEIVVALLGQQSVDPERLPNLVREIRAALTDAPNSGVHLSVEAVSEDVRLASNSPADRSPIPIKESLTQKYIICLEDGKPYRSLKRHLMAKYGLTPEAYRAKWGLPPDYPMVAPEYAEQRSQVAKRSGLGGPRKPKAAQARRAARAG